MRSHRTGRATSSLLPNFGLLLVSALWAIDSLRTDLDPAFGADGLSPAMRQAVLFSIFVVVASLIAVARRIEFPRGRSAWACASIGLGLFVVPAALVACAEGSVSSMDRVAVFSLTPVFAVVLEPYLRGNAPPKGKSALAGALAAVAGILLLLPLDIPSSFNAGVALCALLAATVSVAATNCFAVKLADTLASRSNLPMAVQAGAASAVCFVAAAAIGPHTAWRSRALQSQLLGSLAIDLPALFLLFWLMKRMAASRMTARFSLAPLFTILAGLALERSSPPAQAWFGMGFLACGAGWLVFAPPESKEVEELDPLKAFTADSSHHPPP